jgi:hypothetical protein
MRPQLLLAILLLLTAPALAEETTKTITTIPAETQPATLDEIQRFYEISEKTLELGVDLTLDQPTTLQVTINNQKHYIVATNLSQNQANIIFLGKNKNTINQKLKPQDYIIFKIDDTNLQLTLDSANKNQATINLKLYEQEIPTNVTYYELFDIEVRVTEQTIYSPTDLAATVQLTNFGEGTSHVRLFYSIQNATGTEFHTAIDEKIIETNEIISKTFPNLNIPEGYYTIYTTIYYGDNQEAQAQDHFTLQAIPKTTLLAQPLIFTTTILTSLITVIYLRKKKKISYQQT